MSTTTQPAPALIGNMKNGTNPLQYISLEERDNLVHALLTDCAFYLNKDLKVKTAVRTYDDEFFNLQLQDEYEDYKLLITYYPVETQEDWKINDCNANEINIKYEVYYKIWAFSENKNIIKDCASLVNLLICKNNNNYNDWTYIDTDKSKQYKSTLQGNVNKLLTETPLFTKIQETGFLFFKQEFDLKFTFENI